MRYVIFALALVALFAVPAMAYDGNVSKVTLEKMGLSAMKTMTDVEGASVRGRGFALAFGFSYATGGLPDGYLRTQSSASRGSGSKLIRGIGKLRGRRIDSVYKIVLRLHDIRETLIIVHGNRVGVVRVARQAMAV